MDHMENEQTSHDVSAFAQEEAETEEFENGMNIKHGNFVMSSEKIEINNGDLESQNDELQPECDSGGLEGQCEDVEVNGEKLQKLLDMVNEGKKEREKLLKELNEYKKKLKDDSKPGVSKIVKTKTKVVKRKSVPLVPVVKKKKKKIEYEFEEEDEDFDVSKGGVLVIGDLLLRMAEENCITSGMDVRILGGIRTGELASTITRMWEDGQLTKVGTVVVMVGTNNIRKGIKLPELRDELERETQRLLIAIKSVFGVEVKIGVMGIMGRLDKSEFFVTTVNEGIEKACMKEGGLYVETKKFVNMRYLHYSGLQLTPAGGDILGDLIVRVVKKLQVVGRVIGSGEKTEVKKVMHEIDLITSGEKTEVENAMEEVKAMDENKATEENEATEETKAKEEMNVVEEEEEEEEEEMIPEQAPEAADEKKEEELVEQTDWP